MVKIEKKRGQLAHTLCIGQRGLANIMTAASALRFVLPRALNLFFGLIYPAWFSLAAIESNNTVDDTQWLVYWLIFSVVQIAETCLWPALQCWLYEAVLAPASTRLKSEMAKAPALEFLVNPGGQGDPAAAARTPEEEQVSAAQRRAQLNGAVQEVASAFQADSERISGIQDAKARARAEGTWKKDLSRLAKLSAARASGAAPGGLFSGHRVHAS